MDVCASSPREKRLGIIDTRIIIGRCIALNRLEATTRSKPIVLMQIWTKLFTQTLIAIGLIVVAAVVSRVIYVNANPPAMTDVQEESDVHREVVDCRMEHRPAEHPARQTREDAIWIAGCLDS